MYVKKLVLDGFKSYGKRTEIEGFDPEFTAITGLNGSGKSNILDSICFVLGISNLQNVSNLSKLSLIAINKFLCVTFRCVHPRCRIWCSRMARRE